MHGPAPACRARRGRPAGGGAVRDDGTRFAPVTRVRTRLAPARDARRSPQRRNGGGLMNASDRHSSLAGRASAALLGLACLAGAAVAQGGGFVAGDMFLYNAYAQGQGPADGALLRCDPLTGTTTTFVDLYESLNQVGCAVFDPYRQRVLFSASLAAGEPFRLWFVDGHGVLQDSGVGVARFQSMAPTGDGRVFLRDLNAADGVPLKWLDASGKLHWLLAEGGYVYAVENNPKMPTGGMIYDAGTNSLFLASIYKCSGGDAAATHIRRLPLTPDGRVIDSQVTCVEYQVTYEVAWEVPAGWSRLPSGALLHGVDTNSNFKLPRMLAIDPATLTIMPFASNGPYEGAATTNAVCWSSALGKAVLLDSWVDVLRAFAQDETGTGTVITPSIPLSTVGPVEPTPAMFEVPFDPCAGGWIGYGAGVPGAGGLVPSLIGKGCPAPSAAISIELGSAGGGASALLFVGTAKGTLPLKGAVLNLADAAIVLHLSLGGVPGAAGARALTLPATLPADPTLSGLSVFLQAAFGDPSAAHGLSISNALQMEIG